MAKVYSLHDIQEAARDINDTVTLEAKHHKATGVDGITLSQLLNDPRKMQKIVDDLNNKTYHRQELRLVYIKKERKPGKKQEYRIIKIATARDKVVEKLVLKQIEDEIEKELSDSLYSYRNKRDRLKAISTVKGYRYYLKTDISKFFDMIDVKLLRKGNKYPGLDNIVKRINPDLIWILDEIIGKSGKGIPQGGALGPALSNLYLAELDKELETIEGCSYVRYADDLLIGSDYIELLRNIRKSLPERISRYKLQINTNKTVLAKKSKTTFLGVSLENNGSIIKEKELTINHEIYNNRINTLRGLKNEMQQYIENNISKRKAKSLMYKIGLRINELENKSNAPLMSSTAVLHNDGENELLGSNVERNISENQHLNKYSDMAILTGNTNSRG